VQNIWAFLKVAVKFVPVMPVKNQLAKLRFIGYYARARNNPLRDGSRSG
jgi:hypothetical protein